MGNVAFIDTRAHPSADNYFAMFPNEPVLDTGSIKIDTIKKLPGMTVEDLLQSIKRNTKKGVDILIVCHGTDMGPDLPLTPKSAHAAILLQQNVLKELKKYGDGSSTPDNTAGRMKMSQATFAAFWRLVQDVQGLALNRVEFRSCNVGANNDTLNLLKWFFGSKILGGPTTLDAYTLIDPGKPTSDAATWKNWLEKYDKAKQFGSKPNRFALYVEIVPSLKTAAITESRQAVQDWIKLHLPTGGTYRDGKFISHGVTNNQATDIIWAGESGYRGYLSKVGP
jgi:hypothetical protein